MKKWGFIFLKIAVTGGLLFWMIRSMDLDQVASQLHRAQLSYLFLTLLLTWFGHFLCVVRWKYLLEAFEIPMRTVALVLIYATGMFFNLVFPGLIGGDFVKTYLAARDSRRPYSLAFASIILDRDVGFVAMVLIAVAAVIIQPMNVQGHSMLLWFLGLLAGCIGINMVLFHPGAHNLALRMVPAHRFAGLVQKIELLCEAFTKVRKRPMILAGATLLSLLNQFLVIVASWLIALSLGIHAPFRYFLVFIPATVVITMIPISINGVGLREFATMSFFASIGVTKDQGVLLGFVSSLMIIASSLPGAIAYLMHRQDVSAEKLSAYQAELAQAQDMP